MNLTGKDGLLENLYEEYSKTSSKSGHMFRLVDDGPVRAWYIGDDVNGEDDASDTASSVDESSGDLGALFDVLRVDVSNTLSDSSTWLLSWLLLMYWDKLSQNVSLAKLSDVCRSSD